MTDGISLAPGGWANAEVVQKVVMRRITQQSAAPKPVREVILFVSENTDPEKCTRNDLHFGRLSAINAARSVALLRPSPNVTTMASRGGRFFHHRVGN